ncbi:MAG: glycosyltransferase family 2 protein [Candidatus Kerfeldbacteria bacterium]
MRNAVSVVIVTYNAQDHIAALLESLQKQTLQPSEIIVVDSASSDRTVDIINTNFPRVRLERSEHNLDFAKGYNRGINLSSAPIVMVVNQDVVLEPSAIEKLAAALQVSEQIGAVGPKLLRVAASGMKNIDTVGIRATRARQFLNIGEGEKDDGRYNAQRQVFGLSGAAILLKREALLSIAETGNGHQEYFDEDFIAFKEDVDLSYRLNHAGWTLYAVPNAVGHYNRSTSLDPDSPITAQRQQRTARAKSYSWRNHRWTIIKNEPLVNILLDGWLIIPYECGKMLFLLVREPKTLKTLPSYLKGLPTMLKKRKTVLTSSKISAKQLRQLLFHS